ncbi:hypothetical protein CDCA_CDCA01G0454 [Cyanidium caldarium]|uniref:BTB domain-containing protein n=1 Tax=Cyanidium caldarium TaxID=2771 RepID=A0AAV9IQB0_CYACA|nr:hypothetical protein CDCA_CDCA01G0454 [Cyanidium caldarium]
MARDNLDTVIPGEDSLLIAVRRRGRPIWLVNQSLRVPDCGLVTFEASGSNDVVCLLCHRSDGVESDTQVEFEARASRACFEMVFGSHQNTRSLLRVHGVVQAENAVDRKAPRVSSGDTATGLTRDGIVGVAFSRYWVAVSPDYLEAGVGFPGEQRVLRYRRTGARGDAAAADGVRWVGVSCWDAPVIFRNVQVFDLWPGTLLPEVSRRERVTDDEGTWEDGGRSGATAADEMVGFACEREHTSDGLSESRCQEIVWARRSALIASSPVFRAMLLTSGMREARVGCRDASMSDADPFDASAVIPLPGVPVSAFRAMVAHAVERQPWPEEKGEGDALLAEHLALLYLSMAFDYSQLGNDVALHLLHRLQQRASCIPPSQLVAVANASVQLARPDLFLGAGHAIHQRLVQELPASETAWRQAWMNLDVHVMLSVLLLMSDKYTARRWAAWWLSDGEHLTDDDDDDDDDASPGHSHLRPAAHCHPRDAQRVRALLQHPPDTDPSLFTGRVCCLDADHARCLPPYLLPPCMQAHFHEKQQRRQLLYRALYTAHEMHHLAPSTPVRPVSATTSAPPPRSVCIPYIPGYEDRGLLAYLGYVPPSMRVWRNPCRSGAVRVSASSLLNLNREALCEHLGRCAHNFASVTPCHSFAWVAIDFGPHRRVRPTHYALRHDASAVEFLRDWVLEGRSGDNDEDDAAAAAWHVLLQHRQDRTLCAPHDAAVWSIGPSGAHSGDDGHGPWWRELRVRALRNSSGTSRLVLASLEFYGELVWEPC